MLAVVAAPHGPQSGRPIARACRRVLLTCPRDRSRAGDGGLLRLLPMFVWVLACAASVDAQTANPHDVQPERPSVATHAHTVAPGWLELEFGGERDSLNGQFAGAGAPVAIKLGLAPRVQFTLSTGLVRPPDGEIAAADWGTAVKWRVADKVRGLGAVALLPAVTVSSADSSGQRLVAASVVAISSLTVGAVSADLNVGYSRSSGDGSERPKGATMWACSLGGPLRGKASWGAEMFGYPQTSGPAGEPAFVGALVSTTIGVTSAFAIDAGMMVPVRGERPRALFAGGAWNVGRFWRAGP